MTANELPFYIRRKNAGVVDVRADRKHRLKKLRLLDPFDRFQAQIEVGESQKRCCRETECVPTGR